MKKFLLILGMFFCLTATSFAQEGNETKDGGRLQALKVAYLTKKLNLSPEEAQRFWPIYNKYDDEIRKIRIEQRQKNLPEIDVEDKILTIRKRYNGEFSKALNPAKANTFFRSEKDFSTFVQKELQERRDLRQMRQMNKGRINQ